MQLLWISFHSLPWWLQILWGAYFIYFCARAYNIWDATSDYGMRKGYKYIFFGYNPEYFRLYHLLRMLFDIPPSLLGLLFPFFRAVFKLKLYKFKQPKKKQS